MLVSGILSMVNCALSCLSRSSMWGVRAGADPPHHFSLLCQCQALLSCHSPTLRQAARVKHSWTGAAYAAPCSPAIRFSMTPRRVITACRDEGIADSAAQAARVDGLRSCQLPDILEHMLALTATEGLCLGRAQLCRAPSAGVSRPGGAPAGCHACQAVDLRQAQLCRAPRACVLLAGEDLLVASADKPFRFPVSIVVAI